MLDIGGMKLHYGSLIQISEWAAPNLANPTALSCM